MIVYSNAALKRNIDLVLYLHEKLNPGFLDFGFGIVKGTPIRRIATEETWDFKFSICCVVPLNNLLNINNFLNPKSPIRNPQSS